ncbi:MAG: hypothetical protein AB7G93_21845 [Bdellovibrionales bacterium]
MNLLILIASSLLLQPTVRAAQNQPAQERVKCDIETLIDAEICMFKVAEARPKYQGSNDGMATDRVSALVTVLRLLGLNENAVRQAQKADFAGLMVEHGDEHHIYYFTLSKGKDVSPTEVYDLNTVDIGFELTPPYSAEALDPDTYFLGLDATEIDVHSELAERLEDLKKPQ